MSMVLTVILTVRHLDARARTLRRERSIDLGSALEIAVSGYFTLLM